jgi:hypothetical protein
VCGEVSDAWLLFTVRSSFHPFSFSGMTRVGRFTEGATARRYWKTRKDLSQSSVLVVFLIAGSQMEAVAGSLPALGHALLAFLLFLVGSAIDMLVARPFALPVPQARTLLFSVATRNSFVVLPVALAVCSITWHGGAASCGSAGPTPDLQLAATLVSRPRRISGQKRIDPCRDQACAFRAVRRWQSAMTHACDRLDRQGQELYRHQFEIPRVQHTAPGETFQAGTQRGDCPDGPRPVPCLVQTIWLTDLHLVEPGQRSG